jgi:hypothetical protein
MKSLTTFLLCCLLLTLSACGSQPSTSQLQTAVAGTLAVLPTQIAESEKVIEITEIVEVTKVVEVRVTSTPQPTSEATATDTLEPTPEVTNTPTLFVTSTPTPIQPGDPLGLSFNQLIRRYADMTDLQKQEFVKTLPGKTVYWEAKVYNVLADGTILMDNPYGSGRVTLMGVPLETAIQIDKGMTVDFRGMIESVGGTLGRDIVVTNGDVVRFYVPPTATPTNSR